MERKQGELLSRRRRLLAQYFLATRKKINSKPQSVYLVCICFGQAPASSGYSAIRSHLYSLLPIRQQHLGCQDI